MKYSCRYGSCTFWCSSGAELSCHERKCVHGKGGNDELDTNRITESGNIGENEGGLDSIRSGLTKEENSTNGGEISFFLTFKTI